MASVVRRNASRSTPSLRQAQGRPTQLAVRSAEREEGGRLDGIKPGAACPVFDSALGRELGPNGGKSPPVLGPELKSKAGSDSNESLPKAKRKLLAIRTTDLISLTSLSLGPSCAEMTCAPSSATLVSLYEGGTRHNLEKKSDRDSR